MSPTKYRALPWSPRLRAAALAIAAATLLACGPERPRNRPSDASQQTSDARGPAADLRATVADARPSPDASPTADASPSSDVRPSSDASPTPDAGPSADAGPAPSYVTNIDFEGSPPGAYDEEQVDKDFRARANQPNNLSINIADDADARIVADPDGTRGLVLRATYPAGDTRGRLAWRDHFSRTNRHLKPIAGSRVSSYPKSAWLEDPENGGQYAAGRPPGEPGEYAEQREKDDSQVRLDEVYFAVDLRLDANWTPIPYHKLWGIGEGSPRQASHGKYGCPSEEGYYGLLTWVLLTGREWGTKGDGSMAIYLYETDRAFQNVWLNRTDPSVHRRSEMAQEDFYIPPKGKWITIEVRSKLNTADKVWKGINATEGSCKRDPSPSQDLSNGARDDAPSAGDKPDGILQVWITDPRPVGDGGTGGAPMLMLDKRDVMQRWWSYLKYGHFLMQEWNNHNANTNQYLPQHDQHLWYDNIRVSTSPISH